MIVGLDLKVLRIVNIGYLKFSNLPYWIPSLFLHYNIKRRLVLATFILLMNTFFNQFFQL